MAKTPRRLPTLPSAREPARKDHKSISFVAKGDREAKAPLVEGGAGRPPSNVARSESAPGSHTASVVREEGVEGERRGGGAAAAAAAATGIGDGGAARAGEAEQQQQK